MTELAFGTWVLVADGEKALFLKNITDAQAPNLVVQRIEAQDNPPTREQGTDRPGRHADVGPGQRSSLSETDWHVLAPARFAADMAKILYSQVHKGAFDQIVLVAPPRMLGALREHLHKEVTDRVVAEIAKDMTHHPLDALERMLTRELASK